MRLEFNFETMYTKCLAQCLNKRGKYSPERVAQLVGACGTPKGFELDSWPGHIPRLQVPSPHNHGGVHKRGSQPINVSLSQSMFFSLKSMKT